MDMGKEGEPDTPVPIEVMGLNGLEQNEQTVGQQTPTEIQAQAAREADDDRPLPPSIGPHGREAVDLSGAGGAPSAEDVVPPNGGDGTGEAGVEGEDQDPGESVFYQLTGFMRLEDDKPTSVDEGAALSHGLSGFVETALLNNIEDIRIFGIGSPQYEDEDTVEMIKMIRTIPGSASSIIIRAGTLAGSPVLSIQREQPSGNSRPDTVFENFIYRLGEKAQLTRVTRDNAQPPHYVGPREWEGLQGFVAEAQIVPRSY